MALHALPDIAQAVVVRSDDAFHRGRLLAYVVPHQSKTLVINELRVALSKRLQSYKLPAVFVVLDSLPLTASGKVNRKALELLDQSRDRVGNGITSTGTALERLLAKWWAEIVGVDNVGMHDDFEGIGGDSLTAAQIVSQINRFFPLKQPLKSLFSTPTVAELLAFILANDTRNGQSEKIANTLIRIDTMSPEEIREALKKKTGNPGNV
jgi:acyl carrier protein